MFTHRITSHSTGRTIWRGTGPWPSMQADLADHYRCAPDDVRAAEDEITVHGVPVASISVDSTQSR